MKILLTGATGMIGQGALLQCIKTPEVEQVLALGRSPSGSRDGRVRDVVVKDLMDLSGVEKELATADACLFCAGVSSAGMSEADYTRVTYTLTLAVAQTLLRLNPAMTFIYISGASTDATEQGRTMWARVKGKTENALLRLPFKAVYMFRPGYIQPLDGITSRTGAYRAVYAVLGPFYPLLRRAFPGVVTNTTQLGRALVKAALHGAPKKVLETADINALAG